MKKTYILLVIAFAFALSNIYAQDTKKDTTSLHGNKPIVHPLPGAPDAAHSLAAASSNPLANMISLPVQFNFNFGYGEYDRMQYTTNLMPVIPYKLNKNINMINRIIIPVEYVPNNEESGGTFGVGSTTWSMWVVPGPIKINKGLNFSYGLGPALILPTESSANLGGGAFGLGATFLGVFSTKHIVGGLLVGWAGSYKNDDLNTLWGQYFFTWNIKKGWFITTAPTIGANFNAPKDQQWTVPFGAGGGKIMKLGKLPTKLSLLYFNNVIAPDGAPDWDLQFTITFLFPKKAK
jgi:hypothetical protein